MERYNYMLEPAFWIYWQFHSNHWCILILLWKELDGEIQENTTCYIDSLKTLLTAAAEMVKFNESSDNLYQMMTSVMRGKVFKINLGNLTRGTSIQNIKIVFYYVLKTSYIPLW